MNYQLFAPPPQLTDLVQCFWALESHAGETTPAEYFLMADSCAEIIFQYNESFKKYTAQSARMRFQHSVCDKFEVGNRVGLLGVRLYPHAASELLGIPADEVANRVFDFAGLFKQDGDELADKIYNAAGNVQRVALLTNFLVKKSSPKKSDPVKNLVKQVIEREGWVDVAAIQQQSGLSVKQFERRFKAVAGFTPKYFARIARFQAAKNRYVSNGFKTLTSLAYSCNYFDQSHFNREFKESSGVLPLKYFKFADKEKTGVESTCTGNPFEGYLPCGLFV